VRVLFVLAVNTQVARAIIHRPHVALWPKRLDIPAVKYAAFQQLIPHVLHALLKCPESGGCTELAKKDSWSSDGHLTNITNKQARKYRKFTFSDRRGFKICEMLTHWARAKNITCETMWLFLKSTHLVNPITVVHPWKILVRPGVYDTPGWQALV